MPIPAVGPLVVAHLGEGHVHQIRPVIPREGEGFQVLIEHALPIGAGNGIAGPRRPGGKQGGGEDQDQQQGRQPYAEFFHTFTLTKPRV